VEEILIDAGELFAENFIQDLDDFWIAFHASPPERQFNHMNLPETMLIVALSWRQNSVGRALRGFGTGIE
jgi:hypothetical protein